MGQSRKLLWLSWVTEGSNPSLSAEKKLDLTGFQIL
jgi:hypothetical protein